MAVLILPGAAYAVGSKGTDFIMAFLPNYSGASAVELHLSGEAATNVTVQYPVNSPTFTTTVGVIPGTVTIVSLPAAAASGWFSGVQNNCVRAFADQPFTCYMINRQPYTSDAALAIPIATMNTEYIVTTWASGGPEFAVVAPSDNTKVTITRPGGTPYDVVLNAGQGYYYSEGYLSREEPAAEELEPTASGMSTADSTSPPGETAPEGATEAAEERGDLTGTIIVADRPVGVTNGNRCANFGYGACDHVFEVAMPVQAWGIMIPVAEIPETQRGVVYKILAAFDNTTVSLDGTDLATLNRGQFHQTARLPGDHIFQGNRPIFVMQCMDNRSDSGGNPSGDPALGNMISAAQYLSRYTFSTVGGAQFAEHYLTIIAPNDDVGTLTLDGSPLPGNNFSGIPGSDYSVARVLLAEGVHRTISNGVHGITVEGFNSYDSYLYPGGFGLEYDCNHNGVLDILDVIGGTSADINGNNVPDECEDCNSNGILDEYDIAGGTSQDCTSNGTPDECEADCNTNAIADSCDIDVGLELDCNVNGVPDACDIAGGTSDDCQPNGIPDDCERGGQREGRQPAGRNGTSKCQLPDQRIHGGAFMVSSDYERGAFAADGFTFAEDTTITRLRWWGAYRDLCGEACEPADKFVEFADDFDVLIYENAGGPAGILIAAYDAEDAVTRTVTDQLIAWGSGFTEYEYEFELVPPLAVEAGRRYWVEIRNQVPFPCFWWWETAPLGQYGNGTALRDAAGDGYDPEDLVPYDLAFCVSGLPVAQDCNDNGIEDAEDIGSGGTSLDCQPNGTPDECEWDRNVNGVPDDCDIVAGTSKDRNFNGVPDEADCLTRPGDLNGDCAVDLTDFALFSDCLGKTGVDLLGACVCADLDGNGTVDVRDYLLFSTSAEAPDEACRVQVADACPDSWATGSLGRDETFYDFGSNGHGPIPADFFGPGSDPFGEIVTLVGRPADPNGVYGEVDTQIQHGPVVFNSNGVAEVTLDIITLDLVSKDPITVTYNGGQDPEQWLVIAGLSPHYPGPGQLTAELDTRGGNSGTFDATVYVQPAFLFVRVQDLVEHVLPECVTMRVLDTGESRDGLRAMPPITLSFTDQPFVRVADAEIVQQLNIADCAQGNFVPGVVENGGGKGPRGQQLTCTSHITPGEAHYFCPPECQGDDVCMYTAQGGPTLIPPPPWGCNTPPRFPQATLGGNCPNGVGDCFPNSFRMKPCSGVGFAIQVYGGPSCVPRESTCKGACCNEDGNCVMSTAALCDGDYQGDGTSCDPNPCAKVDLDIDSDNNGAIAEADDGIEMNEPGKLIYLNQDDDDKNDAEDRTQNAAAVADENDLQPINLTLVSGGGATGEVVLSASSGAGNIQVWTSATKGPAANQIALPKTWVLGTDALPATLYVEGIATGGVVLKLAYKQGGTEKSSDEVKAGVVGLDFKKRADTAYGYDDGTVDDNPVPTSADNPPQKYDWVSVDKDTKTTDVDVEIAPAGYATHVHFVSSATGQATVAPAQAAGTPQKLTITGKAVGTPNILCRLGTTSGAEGARLNVGAYTKVTVNGNFYKVRTATLIPDGTTSAQFETGANDFLKQGVVALSLTDNGTSNIAYDVNTNGHLDIDTGAGGGGAEWTAVTTGLGAGAGQKVLHVSDSLNVKIGANWFSATGLNWGEWIVVTDASLDKTRTLAHELLHNRSLADTGPPGPPAKNTANIMYFQSSATKHFVGYFKVEKCQTGSGAGTGTYEIQWDTITR